MECIDVIIYVYPSVSIIRFCSNFPQFLCTDYQVRQRKRLCHKNINLFIFKRVEMYKFKNLPSKFSKNRNFKQKPYFKNGLI